MFNSIICALPIYFLYKAENDVLFYIAIIAFIAQFWSFGIMHNYATKAATQRSNYRGGFNDFTKKEALSVPDRITQMNMVASFTCYGLLITSYFVTN